MTEVFRIFLASDELSLKRWLQTGGLRLRWPMLAGELQHIAGSGGSMINRHIYALCASDNSRYTDRSQ